MRAVKPFEIFNFDNNANIECNIIVPERVVKEQFSVKMISEIFINVKNHCIP